MLFKEMNLIEPLQSAVKNAGYSEPTPIQTTAIPLILAGRDILGCAQTGTGKTAAFALPILQMLNQSRKDSSAPRVIKALILSPTRELALQIYENFELYGKSLPLKAAIVFGGVNQNPQVQKLGEGVDILVATPGRLNDLIGQGYIKLDKVGFFVLDEADRMLDMGFIPDIRKVIALLPQKRQTLLFSATMPEEIETLAIDLLDNPETIKISPVTSTVETVSQSVYFVPKTEKVSLLLKLLDEGVSTALVFTRTKHGADKVVRCLLGGGISAMAIHGNKSQNARQAALESFKTGKIAVLVATDIAARGIDIIELPFVINFDIPEEAETYIHRIGRTGRAGLSGKAISFCCAEEFRYWKTIERLTQITIPEKECEWSVKFTKEEIMAPRVRGGQRNMQTSPAPEQKKRAQNSYKQKLQHRASRFSAYDETGYNDAVIVSAEKTTAANNNPKPRNQASSDEANNQTKNKNIIRTGQSAKMAPQSDKKTPHQSESSDRFYKSGNASSPRPYKPKSKTSDRKFKPDSKKFK